MTKPHQHDRLEMIRTEKSGMETGYEINTLLSTDSGVAFVVKTSEGIIYHAGDLNDWYWEGESDIASGQRQNLVICSITK